MRKLPVGYSDFQQVIEGGFYYVDKSLLIREILDHPAQVLLLPRPRRFGKTLNLSMLRYFFEKTGEDRSHLFQGLQIWQQGEEYIRHLGRYPVIFLTFKDIKERDWSSTLNKLRRVIQEEYSRHKRMGVSFPSGSEEAVFYERILSLQGEQPEFEDALKNLSAFLNRHYQQKVILLIDEYDTPIQSGYVNGYYEEVISFMRNLLSGGLKDNPYLEKGVITGILRVAKESIFSGLNNLAVFTLIRPEFSDKFGFTEEEVTRIGDELGLRDRLAEVERWYNGYIFGGRVIYNPWSLVNYFNSMDRLCYPYWVNTSDNAVVEQLLTRGGRELREELESLIRGESIEKPVEENIVFPDLERREELLWSFLLFGGYLKYTHCYTEETAEQLRCRLAIPNREVRKIFIDFIDRWFEQRIAPQKLEHLLTALLTGDVETFEELLADFVENSLSVWDTGGGEAEKVYQAFIVGLLLWLSDRYEVKSNRESGYGRYDVMLIPRDPAQVGIIMEFKRVNRRRQETPEQALEKAFEQIEARDYAAELRQRGIEHIRTLAVAFDGKQVWVRKREVPDK
ncbi:MAG: AAA family ATPase [Calditrichaeota bacterium]|nr:MAG: AAA family ATPase [Calditrichota bacterium]